MDRGEIWLSKHPVGVREAKRRPFLILSDDAHLGRDQVTVAAVTTTIRYLDTTVFLDHLDGMTGACIVNLTTIMTMPKSDLGRCVAALNASKMTEVERAAHYALGIDLPCIAQPNLPTAE